MAATPLQAEKIHKPTARSGRTRWNRGARRRRGAILTIALIVLVIAGVGAIQDALVEHVGGTVVGDVASDAYGVWGFVLAVTGDQPRAIEAYSRALRLSPKSVALYYLRGLARTLHGDHAAAIDDYTAVAELNPS